MGLSISHGTFDGSYGAFDRFRAEIARVTGVFWPPHKEKNQIDKATGLPMILDDNKWYWPDEGYHSSTHPGLQKFFNHSDGEGRMSPKTAATLADELEALLPLISEGGEGHIEYQGGYRKVTERFIQGCRRAAAAKEWLIFQ